MNESETATPQDPRPGSELMLEVFDAISRRDWDRLPTLTRPDIEVVVHAGPEVEIETNAHIWRAVHIRGYEELQAYLGEFFEALPSVSLIAETEDVDDDCAWLSTEASGVDNEGEPFDARALIEFCEIDGRVASIRADVLHIVRGPALLTEPDGDPRRFFHPFLDETAGVFPDIRRNQPAA
ncbi:MAG TPA: nuclear transport factor 2 family protein [Candidatus Dormibacteraeota bacterium]|jgi:ketosteroid isomerase-like protein|nr:nuclear transport factor 2 family protein [Candidatus Dormibacteraeota bacterium]